MFTIEVWGDYALFTRPEMKTERVTYDVMTPSAARGILDSIYWHPGLTWVIDEIRVLSPIRFMNIRRNEVSEKANRQKMLSAMNGKTQPPCIYTSEKIQQRASIVLKDVHYIIKAHFRLSEGYEDMNPAKVTNIMTNRLKKGSCFIRPCFGTREFPVHFRACEKIPPCPRQMKGERDLGYMLWDMDYSRPDNIRPLFFRAVLKNGVMKVPDRYSGEVIG